jgi:hypothetical protein
MVFEFNPNSPLYDKKRTHEAARLEALVWLHGALRLPRPAEIVERERAEELAAQKRAEDLAREERLRKVGIEKAKFEAARVAKERAAAEERAEAARLILEDMLGEVLARELPQLTKEALESASALVVHDRSSHQRSPAAEKRRKEKKAERRAAKRRAEPRQASEPREREEEAAGTDDEIDFLAAQVQEGQLRETALRRELGSALALVKQERKRGRREAKTALARGKSAERRNSKGAIRKRKAGQVNAVGRAVRKEAERERTGTHPTSAPLHSGELKHRQRLSSGGRGRGGGRGGRAGWAGKGGKGKGY